MSIPKPNEHAAQFEIEFEQTVPKHLIRPTGIRLTVRSVAVVLLASISLLCSQLYRGAASGVLRSFQASEELQWEHTGKCKLLHPEQESTGQVKRMVTWRAGQPIWVAECRTAWFVPQGDYLEFEYAAFRSPTTEADLYIGVERQTERGVHKLKPSAGQRLGTWRLTGVLLDDLAADEQVRVHLIDRDPEAGWLSLRNRVSFYSVSVWSQLARQVSVDPFVWAGIAALSLAALLWSIAGWRYGQLGALFTALCVSVAVHARQDVFFFKDDFMFLERLQLGGVSALFENHFDHIVPLFTGLLYAEYLLFGGTFAGYQVVSFLLHSCNCLLLWRLLSRLGCGPRSALYLACGFFACSWLQLAALQWITCQSILLSVGVRILSYATVLQVVRSDNGSGVLRLFLLLAAAPLCFAGGITVWFEALLFGLLFHAIDRQTISRLLQATVPAACFSAVFYALGRASGALVHKPADLSSFGELLELMRFALLGSQFGAVARALGVDVFIPRPALSFSAGPELFYTACGILCSAVLLGVAVRRRDGAWRFWVFGQGLLMLTLFLVGVGRLHWGGIPYALTIRYHAVSLLGVTLLLAPLVSERFAASKAWFCLVAVWIAIQFLHLERDMTYREYAMLDRSFAAQLKEWSGKLPEAVSYEAEGTVMAGMFPFPYHGFVSDPHAYSVVDEPFCRFPLLLASEQRARFAELIHCRSE